jgi:hypothetical protein
MPTKGHRLSAAVLPAALLLGLALAPGPSASAAELTGFVSGASPSATWGTGYGGMLTITLFNIVGAEIEGAWQGADSAVPEADRYSYFSLSGKAYVGPSIGRFVPYVGLGAGVYRLSLPNASDQGSLGSFFVGAKLKFPLGIVVRGEYQWLKLPQGTLLPLDERFFVGVGLSF